MLSARVSSYGCTREVSRVREKFRRGSSRSLLLRRPLGSLREGGRLPDEPSLCNSSFMISFHLTRQATTNWRYVLITISSYYFLPRSSQERNFKNSYCNFNSKRIFFYNFYLRTLLVIIYIQFQRTFRHLISFYFAVARKI